jgi:hypothetical protein
MLNLLTPVVGSNWRALTEKNITWEASSNNNTVKLEFSSDAGVTWNNIVTNIPASQFNYIWTVPNNVSSNCLVRILTRNSEYKRFKRNIYYIHSGSYLVNTKRKRILSGRKDL